MISGINKVEVSVLSRRLGLITFTDTLIIPDITKTESNNCFIVRCFSDKENNEKLFLPVSKLVLIPAECFFLKVFRGIVPYLFLLVILCFLRLYCPAIFKLWSNYFIARENHALRAQPTDTCGSLYSHFSFGTLYYKYLSVAAAIIKMSNHCWTSCDHFHYVTCDNSNCRICHFYWWPCKVCPRNCLKARYLFHQHLIV